MKIQAKISIVNGTGEGFMGIGLVWLLRRIKRFKSISRAAQDMGMSYVKALKILNRLERNLDGKILVRKRGGRDRGGAELTPFAEKFIDEFEILQQDIKNYAERKFLKLRDKLSLLKDEEPR